MLLPASGCSPAAQAFRLNPDEAPERYRVTCSKRFINCTQKVKEICGSEYQIVEQHSNKPEQELVSQSNLSSTGPKSGPYDWRGEQLVVCGRELPPIRLVRPEVAEAPAADRACIPGTTLACLGPGACSGAQACLPTGAGYGPCDCGPGQAPTSMSMPPVQQPSMQQPPVQQPSVQQPSVQQPSVQQPSVQQPAGVPPSAAPVSNAPNAAGRVSTEPSAVAPSSPAVPARSVVPAPASQSKSQ